MWVQHRASLWQTSLCREMRICRVCNSEDAVRLLRCGKGEDDASYQRGHTMTSPEKPIDLDIALRKLHELALADGNLGSEYWHQVSQLLKRAAGIQLDIDALSRELEKCRAELKTQPASTTPPMAGADE